MGVLAIRDPGANHDVGKNVGIVLGCLAVLIVLLPVLSRSCNIFGRHPPAEAEAAAPSTAQRRHLNAAEIMRLCAIRDSNRPPAEKPVKKSLLSTAEVNLAAPKISFATYLERQQRKASSVTVPPRALIRDQSNAPTSETDATTSTSAETKGAVRHSVSEYDDQEPVCSICLEGYEEDEAVRETVCSHVFHSACLEQWLMKRRSHCPLCQGDLKLQREEC